MNKPVELNEKICPVILSGGSGTRLWPVLKQYPEQFVPLVNDEPLFNATLKRVGDRARYTAPVIVGNIDHKFIILERFTSRRSPTPRCCSRRCGGRNTAAAALVAALQAEEDQRHAPGHAVRPSGVRRGGVPCGGGRGGAGAKDGHIALFGIRPDRPETGYGYIIPGEGIGASVVPHYPLPREAQPGTRPVALLDRGAVEQRHFPLFAARCCATRGAAGAGALPALPGGLDGGAADRRCIVLAAEAYDVMENHAFDTLIMEATGSGAMPPCSMGWSDVGSWQALWDVAVKDDSSNALIGPVIARDVSSSYIRSDGPTVAVLGMGKLHDIATKDVVMVAPSAALAGSQGTARRRRVQEQRGGDDAYLRSPPLGHDRVNRARPQLSGQAHRRETRTVAVAANAPPPRRALDRRGRDGETECDGVEKLIFPNQSIFIPQGDAPPHQPRQGRSATDRKSSRASIWARTISPPFRGRVWPGARSGKGRNSREDRRGGVTPLSITPHVRDG